MSELSCERWNEETCHFLYEAGLCYVLKEGRLDSRKIDNLLCDLFDSLGTTTDAKKVNFYSKICIFVSRPIHSHFC